MGKTPETDEPQVPVEKVRMILKPSAVSKSANKSVLEKLGNSDTTATTGLATTTEQIMLENAKAKREGYKIKKEKKEKKKESKSAADRRDELLKQLKAVENAI